MYSICSASSGFLKPSVDQGPYATVLVRQIYQI